MRERNLKRAPLFLQVSNQLRSYHFMANINGPTPRSNENFIVDLGCRAHVVVDESLFVSFDPHFKPELHSVELADVKVLRSMAEKHGTVAQCAHRPKFGNKFSNSA